MVPNCNRMSSPNRMMFFQNKTFVFLANTPLIYYNGDYSEAWLLTAYDYSVIEPLEAPEDAEPGDECFFQGFRFGFQELTFL